ncbi:hypothetical protein [Parabacteroides sp. ASF519]|uniref:hypothetical protein n=1 Tax=Parabacteroides sp. ASF519 TaxID=1235803 RepID=UPI00202CC8F0|nr:hypothetical protein [Parabacteroides sp. ASF519]
MQWGSGPFTDPKHLTFVYVACRSLYAWFFHMNTEEALWLDEYANDRYPNQAKSIYMHSIVCWIHRNTYPSRRIEK